MAGLPITAMVGHPQAALLAARGPAVAGQQLRPGAGASAAAAAAAAAAADAKKLAGKKRKPQEKAAVEKALQLIPESPLFNSLIMQEHHVDELIKRRRMELQAAANPLDCAVHKRLRVYIYHTHAHQQAAAAAAAAGGAEQPGEEEQPLHNSKQACSSHDPAAGQQEPPQWTLWLWGRLIDSENPQGAATTAGAAGSSSGAAAAAGAGAPAQAASFLPPQPSAQQVQQHAQQKYPFTGFFSKIKIQLDPEQYPGDNGTIIWEKFHHRGAHRDKIEVKRPGKQPVNVSITFEQDFVPPAYKVDPCLAEVLGMGYGQKQAVLTRLYSYIVSKTPQPDLSQLQLDDKLEAILGIKQLPAAALPQALGKLLMPLEPITVNYTVETTGASPGPMVCVDFDVLLPAKLQEKISPAIDPLLDDKQFEALNQKLNTSLTKLFETRRKRAMYLGFAENPLSFFNTIIASQARELRIARTGKEAEVERRTDVFKEKWVEEAAARYLGRKHKQEALFPALGTL